jgi:hypothetical protein
LTPDEDHLTERDLRELAALADGSLTGSRRAQLERRVAASPHLQALVAEQRRAVAAVRAAQPTAPARLVERVSALGERRPARARRRGAIAVVLAAGCALAAVLLFVPGSEPGTPTVAQAEQLTEKPPAADGPALRGDRPGVMRLEGARLSYPDWSREYGWHVAGTRRDRLGNRDATTVLYTRRGHRVGYTVISGPVLAVPSRAVRGVKEGTVLYTTRIGRRPVVVWERRGHTCVLSGSGVSRATLHELASWRADGALPF